MSALQSLKQQLSRLRWYRWVVAVASALCALGIAIACSLLFLAAVDILFELPISQRIAAISITLALAAWLTAGRVREGLRTPEDPDALALLVERNHRLDSDFIAALQFQSHGHQPAFGSPTLQHAVIERAERLASEVNFFDGVDAKPLPARAWTFTLLLAAGIGLSAAFPFHARVFAQRLLLGSQHYPTRTELHALIVNGRSLLDRNDASLQPHPTQCAEGQAIELVLQAKGDRPPAGVIELHAAGQQVSVPLSKMTARDRIQRLREADQWLARDPLAIQQAAALAVLDCPQAAALLTPADADTDRARELLQEQLEFGEAGLPSGVDWYFAELPRHGSQLTYSCRLGDAWTAPAAIDMIPLPAIALEVVAETPAYSQLGRVMMSPGARQLRVLEGSKVEVSARCLNGKRLVHAWADHHVDGTPEQRVDLVEAEGRWMLPASGTPLEELRERVHFAIQVEDKDSLALPTALKGQVSVRPDRTPSGSADVLHRVVLPTARPKIAITASDDFAIQSLHLRLLVEKPAMEIEQASPGVSQSQSGSNETTSSDPAVIGQGSGGDEQRGSIVVDVTPPATEKAGEFPWEFDHSLDLSTLQLAKGDRLKITLEIVDGRGESPGQSFLAAPLVLEITDEAGVLSAVSETDEQSERRLNDLIKQQLGIGDQP